MRFDGHAALGGEIELNLIDLLETAVDVAQMGARFGIKAAEIAADRLE